MSKRAVVILVCGGLALAAAAFYLGSAVFPGVLGSVSDDASIEAAATPPASQSSEPLRAWGFEPGTIRQQDVTTPENAPMAYAALDAAFLSSLTSPAQGQLAGEVSAIPGQGSATITTQIFEALDRSGTEPLLRVLPAGTVVTALLGPVAAAPESGPPLAEGDIITATFTLDPSAGGSAGRVVIQSYERMSR